MFQEERNGQGLRGCERGRVESSLDLAVRSLVAAEEFRKSGVGGAEIRL